MKAPIRNFLIILLAFYIVSQINDGFRISGGIVILVYAALLLTLINTFIKPLLKILFLPINMITLGFFSWVIGLFVLFILTRIVPQIQISTWHFPGIQSSYVSFPAMQFSPIINFILVAFLLSFISRLAHWLEK